MKKRKFIRLVKRGRLRLPYTKAQIDEIIIAGYKGGWIRRVK